MDGDTGLHGLHRGAADLRAEIEAARRALAETAEALTARAVPPTEPEREAPAVPVAAPTGTELVPAFAATPVPYRAPRTAGRSVTVAGAVLAVALLLRRRLSR